MLLKLNYCLSWKVSEQYKNELQLVKIYWMVTIMVSKGWYFLIPQNDQTPHKQFFGNSTEIVWVCLTILWGWCLRVKNETIRNIVQKSCSKNLKLKDVKIISRRRFSLHQKTISRKLHYTNDGQFLDVESQGQFLLENVYNLLNVDSKVTKKTCKMCSRLTEKLLGRRFKCLCCKLRLSFISCFSDCYWLWLY